MFNNVCLLFSFRGTVVVIVCTYVPTENAQVQSY